MKLVTWNVQWCRGVDGRVDPARIARTAQAFADFDVLCLQEIAVHFSGLAGSSGEDQMAALSAALPGFTALFGAATDLSDDAGHRRQFGNAILTHLHHEACMHAGHPRQRGDPGSPFDAPPRPAAVLLCGDYNFGPGSPEHLAMSAPFDDGATPALLDAWTLAHPGEPHALTAGVYDRTWSQACCFDFVFVSADLAPRVARVEVEASTHASDHQPLLVELR